MSRDDGPLMEFDPVCPTCGAPWAGIERLINRCHRIERTLLTLASWLMRETGANGVRQLETMLSEEVPAVPEDN